MSIESAIKAIHAAGLSDTQSEQFLSNDHLRRIVEVVLSEQWEPIETAPKDGRAILVMRNDWPGCKNGVAEECNGHNTYVAAWWPEERGGEGAWICYMDSWKEPECPVEPTHWQALPNPPETKE